MLLQLKEFGFGNKTTGCGRFGMRYDVHIRLFHLLAPKGMETVFFREAEP